MHDDQPSAALGIGDRLQLRASDFDREVTVELLRRHHLEGRLDAKEFEDRLARCYAAKTLHELEALSVDLRLAQPRARPAFAVLSEDGAPSRS